MRPAVLVTGADLAPQAVDLLRDFKIVYAGKDPREDDLVALCSRHDPLGIIVRYGRITPRVIQAAPSLKVISKHGSGVDTIDVATAESHGIVVKAAAGANAAAVAEHAIALLMACAKSVTRMNERMHAGHWDKATHKSIELNGRTLGLIGLGAIGQRTARIAHAIGMRVIGYDPFPSDLPACIEPVTLETIWREADAISLHCPLTAQNSKLLNADVFVHCKRGVIIVNTARGGLIDEEDLLAAVRSGQVGSAGLDSFENEPMTPGHPFQGEATITLSPHIGGVTGDAYVNMGTAAARNLLAVLKQSVSEIRQS